MMVAQLSHKFSLATVVGRIVSAIPDFPDFFEVQIILALLLDANSKVIIVADFLWSERRKKPFEGTFGLASRGDEGDELVADVRDNITLGVLIHKFFLS